MGGWTVNTRKYSRTMDQAFPFGAKYGCAIERPQTDGERMAGLVLAVVIGVCLAAALVHWWAA